MPPQAQNTEKTIESFATGTQYKMTMRAVSYKHLDVYKRQGLERGSSPRPKGGISSMPESMTPLVAVGVIGSLFVLLLSLLTNNYSLNNKRIIDIEDIIFCFFSELKNIIHAAVSYTHLA